MNNIAVDRLAPWLTALAFFVLWWLFVVVFRIENFVLPSPIEAFTALYEFRYALLKHGLATLSTTLAGFALSVVFGLILGILVGSFRLVYSSLYPLLIAFNSVPKAALVPVLVIWFGVGTVPAVVTAFLLSFFPVVVNVATGFATMEPELLDVLRVLGASKFDMIWRIGIPRSLPYFFASLKVSITLAFVGAVISETLASNDGIGYLMVQAASQFRTPLMFAGVAVIAAMGIATYLIFVMIEQRFTGWAMRKHNMPVTGGG